VSGIAERRQQVADALTEALTDQQVKIHPYRPAGARVKRTGWLQLVNVDTEDATYGELRIQLEVVVPAAPEQAAFERAMDELAAPLVNACAELGRGVTVRPYTEVIDAATLLCVVATLTTESEI
jgi:hypothetical protein